jgi:hypothetical protein
MHVLQRRHEERITLAAARGATKERFFASQVEERALFRMGLVRAPIERRFGVARRMGYGTLIRMLDHLTLWQAIQLVCYANRGVFLFVGVVLAFLGAYYLGTLAR